MVTGANSGIGKETTRELVQMGAKVIMVCRDRGRGNNAREEILRTGDECQVELLVADLSSQKDIRDLANEIEKENKELNGLINNAAIIPRKRCLSVDGIEVQFAVNHLAYFLLTHLLLGLLKKGVPSRIINVSSAAHKMGRIRSDDLQAERNYGFLSQYDATKLMNVLFTYELAERLQGTGVTVNCLHPGIIKTNLWREWPAPLRWFLSSLVSGPVKGARTSVYLASSPDVEKVTGKYFVRMKQARTSKRSHDLDTRKRLWKVSEKMTGLTGFWDVERGD